MRLKMSFNLDEININAVGNKKESFLSCRPSFKFDQLLFILDSYTILD